MQLSENMYDLVILRTPDRIGDYTLWHDAIPEYKKKYKGKNVLLVTVDNIEPLVRQEKFFTEIISYNHNNVLHNFKALLFLLKKLRKIKARVAIYPFWTRNIIGDLCICSIQANEKIGLVGVSEGHFTFREIMRRVFNHCYTNLLPNPETISEIGFIEYFTRQFVNPDYHYGYNKFEIKGFDLINSRRYAVVSLSASNKYRIWNMLNFASVIDDIPGDYDVVLTGYGLEDIERAKIVESNVNNKERIINLVSKTSVLQLISLISRSSFVIGNDSSSIHIAAATRTPSICILHGAHFNRFVPYPEDLPHSEYNPKCVFYKMDCYWCGYNCKKLIVNGSYECINMISIDMVKNVLHQLLKRID